MDWLKTAEQMTLDEKIGQMLCTYVNDNEEVFAMARQGTIGALYTYTPGNSVEEAVSWINDLQSQAKYPLMLCEDFEEGVVRFGTWLPSFMGIGATASTESAARAGRVIGRELHALGFGLMGSPVVDVNTNPANPIINTRSFSSSPEWVSDLALAYIAAVEKEGVIATCKHFPGHGDSSIDSHRELAVLRHSLARMEAVELLPYTRAIQAGLKSIMTSHLAFPAIEADEHLPVTLSKNVLTGFLRQKMGFQGLILSDAMEMHAIKKNFSPEEWTALAINAGIDMLIVSYPAQAHAAIKKGVQSGTIPEGKIKEAAARIARHKEQVMGGIRYPLDLTQAAAVIGSPEHAQIAAQIAADSVTCVGDPVNLPQISANGGHILLVTFTNVVRTCQNDAFKYTTGVLGIPDRRKVLVATEDSPGNSDKLDASLRFARSMRQRLNDRLEVIHYDGQDLGWLREKVRRASCTVILASVINQSYNPNSGKMPDAESQVCAALLQTGGRTVLVSAGNPYAVRHLSGQSSTIFTYCLCPASLEAAVRGLTGEMDFVGKLPIK